MSGSETKHPCRKRRSLVCYIGSLGRSSRSKRDGMSFAAGVEERRAAPVIEPTSDDEFIGRVSPHETVPSMTSGTLDFVTFVGWTRGHDRSL